MQRLARVDVAETGDGALIEEGDLDGDAPVGANPGELSCVEGARQRFRTELSERMTGQASGGQEIHHAEATWIAENDGHPGRHPEDHVIVAMLQREVAI